MHSYPVVRLNKIVQCNVIQHNACSIVYYACIHVCMYNDTTIAIVMCLVIRRVYNKEGVAQGQSAASQPGAQAKEKRERDTQQREERVIQCITSHHV